MRDAALAYFITFSCYGAWLHGDVRGSVDGAHNAPTEPFLPPDAVRERAERERLEPNPYRLNQGCRMVVLQTIQEVCAHRAWTLLAVHVRETHVHVVVSGQAAPERMMNDFKAYATRRLRESGMDRGERRHWTRHGSTRYLWTDERVRAAIHYTLYEQGRPMEVFNGSDVKQSSFRASESQQRKTRAAEPRP
jgi:REP element-mobilizing transposase RayT